MTANQIQKTVLLEKIRRRFTSLNGLTLAVWGLAFKAGTDDIREAPALELIRALLAKGVAIQAYDPKAMNNVKQLNLTGLTLCDSAEGACQGADALVICTEWPVFKAVDLSQLKKRLNQAIVFDGRNLFAPELLKAEGFDYYSIGRNNN